MLFKQFNLNIMGIILNSCSEASTCHQHRGTGLSSEDWSCWKRKEILLVLFFVIQSRIFILWTLLKAVESWRRRRSVYGWSENCLHFQVRIVLVNINVHRTGHPLVSMSCVPMFESTTFRNSNLNCWLGALKIAVDDFWKVLSLGQKQALIWQEIFMGNYCQFSDKIF